jgi:hypothetical protein
MLSWKFVIACVIAGYLIVASAVSMMVQYLASAPPASMGYEESSRTAAAPAALCRNCFPL